jgi:hypothetical protein
MSADVGPNIIEDGLVLALDASDPKSYPDSGTTWFDRSGNGNNRTLVNGPVYSILNKGAFTFDGINDCLNNATIANPNGEITFEIALRYNSKGAYHNIFEQSSIAFPILWIRPDNRFELNAGSGLVPTQTYVGQDIIVTAIYRTSSNPGLLLYVNGSLIGQNSTTGNAGPNPLTITLFNRSGGQTYSGIVYYMRIYNRALSASEILQNFNATRSRFNI